MRLLILLLITILLSTFAYGQSVKLKKQKEDTRNGKAKYYVIKDQPSIKHGKYIIKAWSGNEILLEGEYDQGKRVGKWTEKYYGKIYNGAIKSTGRYENDQKVNKWYYFDHKGDTAQIYDHSKNRMIYSTKENHSEYVGGFSALNYELNQIVPIPKELNTPGTNRLSIDTIIQIILNSENKIEKVSFSNPIGYGIEEIIQNWLKDDSKLWIASKENKVITVPLKMTMQF